jgi:hypothetical protein
VTPVSRQAIIFRGGRLRRYRRVAVGGHHSLNAIRVLRRTLIVSHIVEIRTEVRDPDAVAAACRRLGLPEPVHGTAALFEGEATGLIVKLPGWLYPVVFDTATGTLRYDNYGGQWGKPEHLDRLLQSYAVEKARIEARKRGHHVVEQSLSDGSIKLVIQVGGAT